MKQEKRRGRPTGFKMTEESKNQISESKMGKPRSEETKQRISDSLIEHFDNVGRKSNKVVECKGCGIEFENNNPILRMYCKNCLDKFLHNGDIGDYRKVYKKLKNLKAYKLWRLKILVRDKFTCKICGKVGQAIHHLIDVMKIKDIPELLYNIDIGVTLCNICHGKVHGETRANRT